MELRYAVFAELIDSKSIFSVYDKFLPRRLTVCKPTYKELEKCLEDKNRELEVLTRSNEQFRTISNHVIDTILQSDRSGRITFINHVQPGLTREQILSSTIFDYVPPEQRPIVENALVIVFEKGETTTYETLGPGPNGENRNYFVKVAPVSEGNNVISAVFLASDVTARKKAERKLKEREDFFKTLIDSTSDGYFDHNLITDEVFYGERCEEILGYAPGEIKQHLSSWRTLLHPDDVPGIENEVKDLIEGKSERFVFEYRFRNNTEDWQWLLSRAKIMEWDANGKPTRLVGTHQDITVRKNAEDKIKESENSLQESQRVSKLGSYVYDIVNDSISWTATLDNIFGIRDIKKKDINRWISTLHEEDRQILSDYFINDVIGKGKNFDKEYRIINQETGKTVWVHGLGELSYDESNNPINMIGTIQDITERRKAEEELKLSESLYRQAIDNAGAVAYKRDFVSDSFSYMGEGIYKLTGYHPEELTQKIWLELVQERVMRGKCASLHAIEASNLTRTGELKEWQADFRIISKDGKERWLSDSSLCLADKDGNAIASLGILQDITDRKWVEEQLQIRQRMDSLGTLAGGIAHDFNNILVGILGNIDLLNLNNENFTERQIECLRNAERSSIRAANLIRQFQTLSKGTIRGKSTVDVYDISNEVFKLLNQTTDRLINKQIEFKKDQYFVSADSGEMHQVMLNLATNSVQAIEERGTRKGDFIRINAEDYEVIASDKTGLKEGHYVHLTFEDTGVGMSEDVSKRAFDPMFTTKEKGAKKGQGLGLAMVYNIITRRYKGKIYIDSEQGKGTTIHIYLPKIKAKEDIKSKEILKIRGGTETILIIDDEPSVLKYLNRILSQNGYNVILVNESKKAVNTYKKQKDTIDAVILDLTMPHMSGKQVFQKMLEINSQVKVIISSGHSDEYLKENILSEAKSHLNKPYKVEDLTETLRLVLDS